MCLAISSGSKCSNGLFSRIWRPVATTPLRLFSFATIFHLLVGGGILLYGDIGSQPNTDVLLSGFVYGVLPLPILGFLITWIPENYALLPAHYARYNGIYLLVMISLVMLEIGAVSSGHWTVTGLLPLVAAWLLALQYLQNISNWIKPAASLFSRTLLMLFQLNCAILVLNIVGLIGDITFVKVLPYLSMLLVLPIILIVTVLFVIKTSGQGKVVHSNR